MADQQRLEWLPPDGKPLASEGEKCSLTVNICTVSDKRSWLLVFIFRQKIQFTSSNLPKMVLDRKPVPFGYQTMPQGVFADLLRRFLYFDLIYQNMQNRIPAQVRDQPASISSE